MGMEGKVIIARKRSADPAQEHLREQKAIWNKSTTDLIARLIAFKRGLNGRGDPRVGLPPSNIKDPLPPQVGQYLDQIAGEYESIISGAERIIQEQEHYSKVRRKTQPLPTGQPANTNAVPVAAADDGILEKNASWWGSRWWASNFGIKKPERPIIRNMLSSSVSLRDKMLDIENFLSSSDPNSIPKAMYIASSFGIGSYKNLLESFDKLRHLHGRDLADPAPPQNPENAAPKKLPDEPIQRPVGMDPIQMMNYLVEIQKDLPNVQSVVNHYIDRDDILSQQKAVLKKLKVAVNKGSDISIYIGKLKQGLQLPDDEYQEAEKIIMAYRKLLENISQVMGFDALNFVEYAKKVQETPIEVKANIYLTHNPLSRFFNKNWLKHKPNIFRSDIDLDMRKQIAIEHLDAALEGVEKLMDVLVQNQGIDKIFAELKNLSTLLGDVVEDVITLAEYHVTMFRNENRGKSKGKGIILQNIIEREINKLRKANVGIREMSSKILIHRPDFVVVPT